MSLMTTISRYSLGYRGLVVEDSDVHMMLEDYLSDIVNKNIYRIIENEYITEGDLEVIFKNSRYALVLEIGNDEDYLYCVAIIE